MTTLIAGSEGEGANNTAKLTDAWLAKEEIAVEPGDYYFYGTSHTQHLIGNTLRSLGGYGYPVNGSPLQDGAKVRFIQKRYGYPLWRMDGTGFMNVGGGIELVGDGISPAIQICGGMENVANPGPATGRHVFQGLIFHNWGVGFDVLRQSVKYLDDSLVTDENHADNSVVRDCGFYNVSIGARFENQQAVNWRFFSPVFETLTGGPDEVLGFDIKRGGNLFVYNLICNTPKYTLWKVRDYSPNTRKLVCRDFERDAFNTSGQYFKIIKYVGNYPGQWSLDVSGAINAHFTSFPTNPELMFDVPSNLPRKDWRIQVSIL